MGTAVVARVNGWAVKIAKVRGEYVWHAHPDTDEVFLVLSGELTIARRDDGGQSEVRLGPRDVLVVPRGVEHLPSSTDGATIVLIEPTNTLTTGARSGSLPEHLVTTSGITPIS